MLLILPCTEPDQVFLAQKSALVKRRKALSPVLESALGVRRFGIILRVTSPVIQS